MQTENDLFATKTPLTPEEASKLSGLRCITVYQPYASLIALGLKRIETRNRSWKHRGPVLIQAGKKFDSDVIHDCLSAISAMKDNGHQNLLTEQPWEDTTAWGYPFRPVAGKVIAVANMVDSQQMLIPPDDPIEEEFGHYGPGRYGWKFGAVRTFEVPVPVTGKQGVFFAKF